MSYIVNHIPKSNSKRPGKKIVPKYITIHSTGNKNQLHKTKGIG